MVTECEKKPISMNFGFPRRGEGGGGFMCGRHGAGLDWPEEKDNVCNNITVKSFYVNKNVEFRRRAQNEIANHRQTLKDFHCKLLGGLFVQILLKKRTSEFQENFPRLTDTIHSNQFQ